MLIPPRLRSPLVFGAADGVTVFVGIIAALAVAEPSAVARAAAGAGLAELIGMSQGQYLSDTRAGLAPAIANGAAAFCACFAPATPYLLWRGGLALALSLILVAGAGCAVSWLRPEKGILAAVQTFGVLAAAGFVCVAASLWPWPVFGAVAGLAAAAYLISRRRA